MNEKLAWLKGKKTYICAVLGAVVVLTNFLNLIDSTTANTLIGLLGFGGFAALRASK